MRFNARRLQAGAQVVGCARLRAVARQTMALGAWGHRAFIRSSLAQRGASDTVGRMFAPRCACGAYGGCCDESGFGQQLLEAGVIASRSRLGVSWFQRSRNVGHIVHTCFGTESGSGYSRTPSGKVSRHVFPDMREYISLTNTGGCIRTKSVSSVDIGPLCSLPWRRCWYRQPCIGAGGAETLSPTPEQRSGHCAMATLKLRSPHSGAPGVIETVCPCEISGFLPTKSH